ncbi:MAG: hypothetical protein R3C10_17535 [Pirellulales bacterium]
MGIVVLHHPGDHWVAEVVYAALCRSFTVSQVQRCHYAAFAPASPSEVPRAAVLIHPDDAQLDTLSRFLSAGRKALVFGRPGDAVADRMGLQVRGPSRLTPADADARLDRREPCNVSPVAVRYTSHPLAGVAAYSERPLCRFDFELEWNNLGFGRIPAQGRRLGHRSRHRRLGADVLATLDGPGDATFGVYAAITDRDDHAVLWFNRAVGPVDSLEWRLIERFLGDYRHEELASLPYVAEIPAGFDAAVTMRLDCDEAVATALPLLELYADHGRPLSLAILTGLEMTAGDLAAMDRVLAAGGAVVSHSQRHMPNWGGSHAAALAEATQSRRWLEARTGRSIRFAVSPFHQNPPYAVQALADAGYAGFVGGIIANDPEYLLGRAGRVPFCQPAIVSHSAQSMLHGDCYHRYGNTIAPHADSFDHHMAAGTTFGYLDHPFSSRYQYGWHDEAERLAAHAALLAHMAGRAERIWWPALDEAMAFLVRRDVALVEIDETGTLRTAWPEAESLATADVASKADGVARGVVCWKDERHVV